MPISTPFTAGMDMIAAPMRPSSLRSHETCEPSPTGSPSTTTSQIAAERVPRPFDLVDVGDHPRFGVGVERAQRRRVGGGVEVLGHGRRAHRIDAAEVHEVAPDANVELGEKTLADGGGGDARRRLARRRALENVARVVAVVLENAGEIGVAGAHARDGAGARRLTCASRRRDP